MGRMWPFFTRFKAVGADDLGGNQLEDRRRQGDEFREEYDHPPGNSLKRRAGESRRGIESMSTEFPGSGMAFTLPTFDCFRVCELFGGIASQLNAGETEHICSSFYPAI